MYSGERQGYTDAMIAARNNQPNNQ